METHLWGTSRHRHVDELTEEVAICATKAGGASSMHFHRGKSNTFLVLSGRLAVDTEDGTRRVLGPHQSVTVAPRVRHRMVFLEPTEAIELYVAIPGSKIDTRDIVRLDEGWRPGERSISRSR